MPSCAGGEPFALRVIGDSMEPEFPEGTIVIVEPDDAVEAGCFVIALHENECFLRQLQRDGERWLLQPLNPRYPTLELPGPSAIRGRVIERAGRPREDRKRYL